MYLHVQPKRQFDPRDRTFRQMLRIHDDEFALHLCVIVGNANEVAVTFARVTSSRDELWLGEPMGVAGRESINAT